MTIRDRGSVDERAISDADYARMAYRLDLEGYKTAPIDMRRAVVQEVAHRDEHDSAITWLEGLSWDRVPRVDLFCETYLGAEPGAYAEAVSRYWWTAMAARVLNPGHQCDMVPILVGAQGERKTSLLRALVPNVDWFGEIGLGADRDADTSRKLRGKVLIELGELRGFGVKDIESVKSFITKREESWIEKYQTHETRFARRCIFVGTTNQTMFLNDATGERRWLPITVNEQADLVAVSNVVDQLWAEARERFRRSGVAWKEAEELARAEHERFKLPDYVGDAVAGIVALAPGVPLVFGAVAQEVAQRVAPHRTRPNDIAAALLARGYRSEQRQHQGRRQRVWVPPADPDAPTAEVVPIASGARTGARKSVRRVARKATTGVKRANTAP